MCGISGYWCLDRDRSSVRPAEVVGGMLKAIVHRGPDDSGIWEDLSGGLALGHRRLSIVDLSPNGHQPMVSNNGRYILSFNGEIYNHLDLRSELADAQQLLQPWRGSSDTETLLESIAIMGLEKTLEKVSGMFAFALWDNKENTLALVRDRAGEKPLFVYQDSDSLAFSSELKAIYTIKQVPRKLDGAALEYYLAYGYVPTPLCLVQGCAKVQPGRIWRYRASSCSPEITTYWKLPPFSPSQANEGELLEEYESILSRSVRQSLQADVPVGVLLSGGVDSGLIAALGARSGSRRIKTFTMSFPGHGVYDEGPLARKVAEHLGTDHHELTAESMTVDLLPEMARIYDEPIADSSMLPTFMVCRLLKQHVTVALGGDGGDELFAGYPQYKVLPKLVALHRLLPSWFRQLLAPSVRRMQLGTKGRGFLLGVMGSTSGPLAGVNLYYDQWNRNRLVRGDLVGPTTSGPENWRDHLANGEDGRSINTATRTDFLATMQDSYLVKTDRASMANSIELRSPFLDRQLIEFAFGRVSDGWKVKNRQLKYLSRRLAEKYLPPEVVTGAKKGFTVPLGQWLSGEWGHFFREVLSNASHAPLSKNEVDKLWLLQEKGYSNAQRIFQLTMLELWMREYNIQIPTKPH